LNFSPSLTSFLETGVRLDVFRCHPLLASLIMSSQRIVIYRSSVSRTMTAQTDRDNAELLARMRRASACYKPMEAFLEGQIGSRLTREKLFSLANRLYAQQIVDDPPDRLCRRKKEALVCWFCEHLVQVYSRLTPRNAAPPERLPEFEPPVEPHSPVDMPGRPSGDVADVAAWGEPTPSEDDFADMAWSW
jgi:hypothetical protein